MSKNEQKEIEIAAEALKIALRDVFGENVASKRFIDVTRIPLLCKSVIDTNESLKSMGKSIDAIHEKLDKKYVTKENLKGELKLVKLATRVVFSFVALIVTSVIIGLLALLFRFF